jgi:hypothetical protein
MAQLREAAGAAGLKGTPEGRQFGILHGVSQLVYLVESVLAGVLLVKIHGGSGSDPAGRTPDSPAA